jgi:hypothetical protein
LESEQKQPARHSRSGDFSSPPKNGNTGADSEPAQLSMNEEGACTIYNARKKAL